MTPPLYGFSKNVSSKERVKSCFFVTFNIITSHIFPENFVETPQVVQKTGRFSLSILAIFIDFHQFSSIFWTFWHFIVTKKQMIRLVFLETWERRGVEGEVGVWEGGGWFMTHSEKTILKKPSPIKFNEPWHICDEVFNSEPFVIITYLDS